MMTERTLGICRFLKAEAVRVLVLEEFNIHVFENEFLHKTATLVSL